MDDQAWYLKGFRKARQAGPAWNLAKTATHTTLFWSTLLFLVPWQLAKLDVLAGWGTFSLPGASVWPWVGFVMFGALGLWSGATMAYFGQGTPLPLDFPNRLVVRGPYRYVRNPMALAGLTQGLFVAMHLGSWLTIGYVVAGGLIWNSFARPPEEHHLELEFGQEYRTYKEHVGCWIPRLRPYTPA